MDKFMYGMMAGVITSALVFLISLHVAEDQCQKEHNVYDCVLAEPAFIPAPTEKEAE